jgi:putative transposase
VPRPRRIVGAGLTYHIYVRGNNGEAVFKGDTDRQHYLSILAEARTKYVCRVFAYVLMTNHIHFVIQTAEPNISEIIWWAHGHYASILNHKSGRYGHLFATRFHSRVIDSNEYLLQSTCYIHLNPVRAGLVERPEDYEWSSYRMYANEYTVDSLVDVTAVLGVLSNSVHRARSAYVEFVNLALTNGLMPLGTPLMPASIRGRGGAVEGVREPTSGLYLTRRDPLLGISTRASSRHSQSAQS